MAIVIVKATYVIPKALEGAAAMVSIAINEKTKVSKIEWLTAGIGSEKGRRTLLLLKQRFLLMPRFSETCGMARYYLCLSPRISAATGLNNEAVQCRHSLLPSSPKLHSRMRVFLVAFTNC